MDRNDLMALVANARTGGDGPFEIVRCRRVMTMPRSSDAPHDRTYICDQCGGTFEDARDDEEAQVEALAMFGKRGDDPDMAIVCHDCYLKIMRYS